MVEYLNLGTYHLWDTNLILFIYVLPTYDNIKHHQKKVKNKGSKKNKIYDHDSVKLTSQQVTNPKFTRFMVKTLESEICATPNFETHACDRRQKKELEEKPKLNTLVLAKIYTLT